jgi:hypothetical protein
MSSPSPPVVVATSPTATSTGSGATPTASWVAGTTSSTGTAAGMSLPSASAPVIKRQLHQSYLASTTTLRGYFHLGRVLTFNDAGLGQGSLSGRRLGLCLRGESGLPSGRHGFLFRHRCGRFIPLPGQIRRFPAEHTCWLSTQYDYHIQRTTREESTLTSSTGPPSRLGSRGYWQCRPVLPRQAPPLAPQ